MSNKLTILAKASTKYLTVSDLVDIATNLKVVDLLDTFYLNNDTNKSYNKPNDPQEFQPPNSNNELPRIIGDR